jgi:hypothetical protein
VCGGSSHRGGVEATELRPNSLSRDSLRCSKGVKWWWGSESESQGGPQVDNVVVRGKGEKRMSAAF